MAFASQKRESLSEQRWRVFWRKTRTCDDKLSAGRVNSNRADFELDFKLPGQDSNLDKENQNLLCYRYTTGYRKTSPVRDFGGLGKSYSLRLLYTSCRDFHPLSQVSRDRYNRRRGNPHFSMSQVPGHPSDFGRAARAAA